MARPLRLLGNDDFDARLAELAELRAAWKIACPGGQRDREDEREALIFHVAHREEHRRRSNAAWELAHQAEQL